MPWKPGTYTLLVDSSEKKQEVIQRRASTIGDRTDGAMEWRRAPLFGRTDQEKSDWVPFGRPLPDHWTVQEGDGLGGEWKIDDSDGTLVGKIGAEGPSILWCDLPLEGDHMIEVQASTVPPFDNDISVLWDGPKKGWGTDGPTAIGGIGGWWHGYAGVEATTGARCTSQTGDLVVGKIYNIAAGRVSAVHVDEQMEKDGTTPTGTRTVTQKQLDFLFVDGVLVQLVTQSVAPVSEQFRHLGTDSSTEEVGPRPRASSHVGITTWNSEIKIHALRISTLESIQTTTTSVKG